METKLLPLAKVQGREFLVDIKNRQFRDFDDPGSVVMMHSREGRELLEQMKENDWNSMGISTGRQGGIEV